MRSKSSSADFDAAGSAMFCLDPLFNFLPEYL
jgi:hypothetical protein